MGFYDCICGGCMIVIFVVFGYMVIYFIMFCWMFDMCECIDIYVYEDNVIMLQVSGKCDKTFSFNIKFRHDQTITQL